jgi:S-adenosylmethionine/arginine decarboxylase-like enzyme
MPSKTTLRQRYQKRQAWGILASIDLAGCDNGLIQSPRAIKEFVASLVKHINMQTFGPIHLHQFGEGSLHGYSVMQFIETSSIVIHFDDKLGNRAFIDVFSCKYFDPKKAETFAKKFFKAKKSKTTSLLRY